MAPAAKSARSNAFIRHFWSFIPLGGSLPEDVWLQRHRFLTGLTWLHALIIALIAWGW